MDHTQEFLAGLEEHVQEIYNDLDALREAGPAGPMSRALIDRLFRRVHSIKGSASTFGLNALSQIAHEFESLLHAARSGRVLIAGSVLVTAESAVDALAESVNLAASGVVEPSRSHLFEQLQAITRTNTREPNSNDILAKVPDEISRSLTDPEKHQLASALNEGVRLYIVSSSFDLANFDEEFFRLKESLAERGEVISTSPSLTDAEPDRINFRVLYAGRVDAETLKASLKQFAVKVELIETPNARPSSTDQKPSRRSNLSSASAVGKFVRTDLDTLDQLISSTHQLFRQTTGAFELALNQRANASTASELEARSAEIKSAFLNVEDELINLRMVSLAATLQRAVRAGRTAARLAGKDIDFEFTGGDLRVDKFLADAIADPLAHLIRNAVDHGIENNEERTASGKRRRGTIRIEATSEGGRSRVRVSDDGRGVDPKLISATAHKLGLLEENAQLDLDRSLRLIFRPGFTTAESTSEVSGRGVGLDVVETAVEQAGGELRVSSAAGNGTTFEIRLPVTFGIMEARVVVSDGYQYCIPADQTCPDPGGNAADLSFKVSNIRDGRPVAASSTQISLRELLGQSSRVTQTVSLRSDQPNIGASNTAPSTIMCSFTDDRGETTHSKKVEISVDEIRGVEKVLVRSLGRHAGRWYGVAGATELSNGSIALVLDLPRLLSTI